MKYLELSEKKYEEISKLCLVRHVSDSGLKSALMARMCYYTKSGATFATNLDERCIYRSCIIDALDDDLFAWEYDIVVVPYDRVEDVRNVLARKDKNLELK